MGKIFLNKPDGTPRPDAQAYFGADCEGGGRGPEIANEGEITEVEVLAARGEFEKAINQNICGYGGPLGLGGWGGINEVCVQPWNLGGPAREQTPDGFSMPVKVHLEEDYYVPTALPFLKEHKTVYRDVEMTIRWESGRVRLYQGTPPVLVPPNPTTPPPADEFDATIDQLTQGVRNFFVDQSAKAVSWVSETFAKGLSPIKKASSITVATLAEDQKEATLSK